SSAGWPASKDSSTPGTSKRRSRTSRVTRSRPSRRASRRSSSACASVDTAVAPNIPASPFRLCAARKMRCRTAGSMAAPAPAFSSRRRTSSERRWTISRASARKSSGYRSRLPGTKPSPSPPPPPLPPLRESRTSCSTLSANVALDEVLELLRIERLGKVLVGAEREAALAVAHAALGGDDEERRLLVLLALAHVPDELEPGEVGHVDVGDDEV